MPNDLLASLESKYQLPNGLLNAVMKQESGGNIDAVSPKGARGAFQFMPATAKQYGVNTSDLASSADGAARMYADLLKTHNGDLDKALASYNYGQGNVSKHGMDNLPKETQDYIVKVKSKMPPDKIDQSKVVWDEPAKDSIDASKIIWDEPKQTAPLSVVRDGKTYTASNNTFQDDLKAELAANPISAKLAAAGTALSDIYQGGKQLIGIGDKQAIANNKTIADANPASALAGNVALMLGTGVAAPVLNTAKGITATGAVVGGLTPTENGTVREHAGNALLGGATAEIGNRAIQKLGSTLINSKAAQDAGKVANSVRDSTLKMAQDAGFTIPRSLYNPSFLSNTLESFGGKAAVKQASVDKNQTIVNDLAKKSLNLPSNVPLSTSSIESVRKQAYKPYEQVASLSTGASNTLEALKQNRADATAWFNSYNRSANPNDLAKAKDFKDIADTAENVLEDYAKNAGRPELINQLKDARKTIAKTYTVERAFNKDNGQIDARVLGRISDKGKPLSDGLDTIGKFSNAFSDVAPKGKTGSGAGISYLDAVLSGSLAGAGGLYTGSPEGAALGVVPLLARPATRGLALSKLMQKTPKYELGKVDSLLKALSTSRYAPMALAGAAVPTLTK